MEPFATGATPPEVFLRLLAALGAGLVLGFDREWKGHAAGLKTHMLVALAAAGTAAVALELHAELMRIDPNTNADPLRIVEGLVAAVGFLGGGMIIFARGRIQGLTTAANLWGCGTIGLAFGSGEFAIGAMMLGLAVVVLVLVGAIEPHIPNADKRDEEP